MTPSKIHQTIAGVMLVGTLTSCSLSNTPADTTIPTSTGITRTPSIIPATPVSTISFHKVQTVDYSSPAGNDQIGFNMTVKDGIITNLVMTPLADANHKGSVYAQKNFINAAQTAIVGKPVASLSIDAVGGASLTTQAFEQFVTAALAKQK